MGGQNTRRGILDGQAIFRWNTNTSCCMEINIRLRFAPFHIVTAANAVKFLQKAQAAQIGRGTIHRRGCCDGGFDATGFQMIQQFVDTYLGFHATFCHIGIHQLHPLIPHNRTGYTGPKIAFQFGLSRSGIKTAHTQGLLIGHRITQRFGSFCPKTGIQFFRV